MRRAALAFRIVFCMTVVVLAIGIYGFVRYVDSPATASDIINQTPITYTAPKSKSTSTVTHLVSGQYASFSYPSLFTPDTQQPVAGNILASYVYVHRAFVSWQLTITINYLPSGSANSDSAYYAMKENAGRYNASTQTVSGGSMVTMTDTQSDGFGKVDFLFHNSYSADISLSSQDATDTSGQLAALNQIIASWKWN